MDRYLAASLLAALLGAALPAPAPAQVPAPRFPAPAGWARSDQGQVTTFRPPGEPPDSVLLWVLPPMARQSDFGAQVEALRATLVAGAGLGAMRNVETHRAGPAGREQQTHSATYASAAGDHHLMVLARAEGAWVGTVVLLANDAGAYARHRPAAAKLFDGLRLAGGPDAPAPAATPTRTAGFRGPGISGVWMARIQDFMTLTQGRYELVWRWRTFFDDGAAFADLPDEGLFSFDRAASQASPGRGGYWWTYTFAGAAGEARRAGTRSPWVLRALKANELKIDDDVYYRCASVDGVRLEGAWTSYANPEDPDLDRLPAGQRPILRFGRDGRFVDEGLFAVFMRSYSGGDDRPGAGSYELRDFTAILRYDDGRVRREAFNGLLSADVARSNDVIFLRRTPLQKRGRR